MHRRVRTSAAMLAVTLVLAIAPATASAQDDAVAGDSMLPDLAPIVAPSTPADICGQSGGVFTDDGRCRLSKARLDRTLITKAFRSLPRAVSLDLSGPFGAVDGESVIDDVAFLDFEKVGPKTRKALNKVARRKSRSVIDGKNAKLKDVGVIALGSATRDDGSVAFGDDWLVRITSGTRVRDFGVVGGKDYVRDDSGQKQPGLAVVEDGDVIIAIPGGVRRAFTIDIVHENADGSISSQHIGGPGSPTARIPVDGTWSPSLACAEYTAEIDFDSTTDGVKYDLLGVDFVFETPVLPPFATSDMVTADVTLAPRGTRARKADAIALEGVPVSVPGVRSAIAVDIDLSEQLLRANTGYHLQERPFDLMKMTLNLDSAQLVPFDRDAAVELLEESGWVDNDGDGQYTRESSDLAAEARRFAGGGHTSRPLFYGDPTCAGDAHLESIIDICQLPDELGIDIWGERLSEELDALVLQPGLFPGGLYGCTVLGPQNQLLSAFAASPDFATESAFDAAWIEWAEQIDCAVSASLPLPEKSTSSRVADCDTSGFEIWATRGIGTWAYALLPGDDLTVDQADAFIRTFAARDADADGISDRFDPDLDGDGTPDVDDVDDDGDGTTDTADFAERSADSRYAPSVEAGIAQMRALILDAR